MIDKKHAPQLAIFAVFIALLIAAVVLCGVYADICFDNVWTFIVTAIAFLVLAVAVFMFLIFNDGLFFSSTAMTGVFCTALAVLPIVGLIVTLLEVPSGTDALISAIALLVLGVALFVYLIIKALVVDLFQPIALNTLNMIMLIAGSVFMLIAALVAIITKAYVTSTIISATLLLTMLAGAAWAKNQKYGKFTNIVGGPYLLFEGKTDGYSAYRIPSLIVLDKDIVNEKCGTHFKDNVLLALVEGRKNSAHDVGVVDMLGKFSLDGGKTWGEQKIIFTFGEEVGKYGNPTVVLDKDTGLLNIVHMSATKATGFNYNTFNIRGKIKDDLTFDWEEPINISLPKDPNIKRGAADGVRADTLMVGPGKAVQIKSGKYDGRIICPASNNGSSFVIYSDDHGLTWKRSEVAGSGNECEAAVLDNGEVVMVVRDGAGCCNYHPRQFQKLSYSKDGGETWYVKEKFTTLKTPICMASVYNAGGKLLLSYPDSFHTRVNLSVGETTDGETWTSKLIYGGAAGYSCMDGDKEGNVYVLAEIGKVNYSDAIGFAKLDIK